MRQFHPKVLSASGFCLIRPKIQVLAQNPIWIFLLVQSHVISANSSKTAEKPEHFLCTIIPKTMSVSPQTKDTECTNEGGKLERRRQSGGFFGSSNERGLSKLQSEGREVMLHLSGNWIRFWVASVAGCLCAPQQVCACHNRTLVM